MKQESLAKMISDWDISLDTEAWAHHINYMLVYTSAGSCITDEVEIDLDALESRLKLLNRISGGQKQ